MAIDLVSACAESVTSASPSTSFVIFAAFFAAYIGVDVILSALVIARKIAEHSSGAKS